MASNGAWRVIAQRIRTGEILEWDVPLNRAVTTRELSGPGGVFGAVEPEILDEVADDGGPLLEEWSTALYVEEDHQIRAGGIVSKIDYDKQTKLIEATGFTGYPTGIPYTANYLPNGFEDPVTVFKNVWDYVQKFEDGNLGVRVTGSGTWMVLTNGSSGPFTIRSFEARDCGEILESLAGTVPFDYVENHSWTVGHDAIDHQVRVGFPRLGKRHTEAVLVDGENVEDFAALGIDGSRYANDVYLFGQGAGSAMRKSRATQRHPRKLRRCAVVNLASQGGQGYLDRKAKQELRRRQITLDIPEVTITDHENARIAEIQPGDDIEFQGEVSWLGEVRMWLRVIGIDESGSSPGRAVLKTQRADTFTYASEKSPTGEPVPVSI